MTPEKLVVSRLSAVVTGVTGYFIVPYKKDKKKRGIYKIAYIKRSTGLLHVSPVTQLFGREIYYGKQ